MLYYKQKDNRPQGGLPLKFGLKNRLVAANYRGGFSMSRLSAVLKDKSQQCQNEHAKSHQVFEIIVLHRHHLDSLREFRQCHPATRSSRKYFIIIKQNIQRTSCEVCRCMFFIFYISFILRPCHAYKQAAASATALPARQPPFPLQHNGVHAPGSACSA